MKRRRSGLLVVVLIGALLIGCEDGGEMAVEMLEASTPTRGSPTDTPLPPTETPPPATDTPVPPTATLEATSTPRPPAIEKMLTPNVNDDTGENEYTTLLLTGDSMLGRSVNFRAQRADRSYPFSKVSEEIQSADIAVTNLESPLVKNCPLTNGGMVFCGHCTRADSLKLAGFDVAMISNNHIKDWGQSGYLETVDCLRDRNIDAVGVDHTCVKSINGVDHGFLGYSAVWRQIPEDVLKQDIERMKRSADNIIVYFHWGKEYTSEPTEHQIAMAHQAIDNGADVVFGSHPHWIQPMAVYKDKPIFFSLGNFVFDQGWSKNTMRGLAVKLFYDGETLVDMQLLPVRIHEDWSASWVEGAEKERFLQGLQMSEALAPQR